MCRFGISGILFLLLLLLGQNTMADQESIKLGDVEGKLVLQSSHLDDVARWHGEYRLLRDYYYSGPSGIVVLAQQWLDTTVTWIENLHGIIELIRSAEEQLESKPVQHHLIDKINKAQEDWSNLKNVSRRVVEQGDALKKKLLDLGELPDNIIDGHNEITHLLNERHRELLAAVSWSVDAFSKKEQICWDEVLNSMVKSTRALIKRSVSHHSSGFKQIERVRQFLLSRTVYEPLFVELKDLDNKLLDCVAGSRIFTAGKVFDEMTDVYYRNLLIIENSSFDSSFKDPAIKRINNIYESSRNFYTDSSTHSNLSTFVDNNLRRTGERLIDDCLDEQKRFYLNCNLIHHLVSFNPFEVSQMTDDELELIEDSIERVKKGPLL